CCQCSVASRVLKLALAAGHSSSDRQSSSAQPFIASIGNLSTQSLSSMAANVCQAVDNLVAAHHVVVFSKSWCPYSRMAKEALANYKIDDLHVWEIDTERNSSEIQSCLKTLTGA